VADDATWIRLQATADADPSLFPPGFLEEERRALGEDNFKREYLGIPAGGHASPFTWELYEGATHIEPPLVEPGSAFRPPVHQQGTPTANPFRNLKPSGVVP
jgi:hypothetical protein